VVDEDPCALIPIPEEILLNVAEVLDLFMERLNLEKAFRRGLILLVEGANEGAIEATELIE
jgi:hypothetical protein